MTPKVEREKEGDLAIVNYIDAVILVGAGRLFGVRRFVSAFG